MTETDIQLTSIHAVIVRPLQGALPQQLMLEACWQNGVLQAVVKCLRDILVHTRSKMMVPIPAPTGSENSVNAAVENTI